MPLIQRLTRDSAAAGGRVWPLLLCGTRVDWSSFSTWHSPARFFFRRAHRHRPRSSGPAPTDWGKRPELDIAWCVGLSWSYCGNSGPSRPKRSSLRIQTSSSGIARVSACMGVAGPGGPGRPRISEAIRVLMRRLIEFHPTASYGRSRSDTDRVDVGRNSLQPIAPNEGTLTGP